MTKTTPLRTARFSMNLTLKEASHLLGLHEAYLSQIETGKRTVTAELADKMERLYKRSKEDFLLIDRYAVRQVEEGGSEVKQDV